MIRQTLGSLAIAALIFAAPVQASSSTTTSASPSACVFVLHGLARGVGSMARLSAALRDGGFRSFDVAYPSTSGTFDEMVETLSLAVSNRAPSCREVHFVGYSLGALVVRGYLARERPDDLGRVVMIAPPNQGSEIVDRVGDTWLFRTLMGSVAADLGTSSEALPSRLPAPDYPVGVIAGDRVINVVGWFVIPGVHDGTVSVERTRIAGMADFRVVPRTHTFIMSAPEVAAQTISFLRHGRFDAADEEIGTLPPP